MGNKTTDIYDEVQANSQWETRTTTVMTKYKQDSQWETRTTTVKMKDMQIVSGKQILRQLRGSRCRQSAGNKYYDS